MNCLIIDDNKIARTTLRQLASHLKDVSVIGECANAIEAYNVLSEQQVDFILLDIEMPGMTGIELTRNLGNKSPVIVFITAKRDYAPEAFDLNVADYIVKPVTVARFVQSIEKVREVLQSRTEEVKVDVDEFIFIRDSNVVKRLKLSDILYIEAMGDYVKLYTSQRFFAIHATLKAVGQRLPATQFLRVHRSFMVAIDKIDTVREGVLIVNEKPVPVADAYRAALNKRMNIL
jgi:DNA-binding LytR/AlgR family response regulator